MKFKDYVRKLNKMLESNPEIGEYKTIAAIDDEGNGFNEIVYNASVGDYDGSDFYSDADIDKPNAVCVN